MIQSIFITGWITNLIKFPFHVSVRKENEMQTLTSTSVNGDILNGTSTTTTALPAIISFSNTSSSTDPTMKTT